MKYTADERGNALAWNRAADKWITAEDHLSDEGLLPEPPSDTDPRFADDADYIEAYDVWEIRRNHRIERRESRYMLILDHLGETVR